MILNPFHCQGASSEIRVWCRLRKCHVYPYNPCFTAYLRRLEKRRRPKCDSNTLSKELRDFGIPAKYVGHSYWKTGWTWVKNKLALVFCDGAFKLCLESLDVDRLYQSRLICKHKAWIKLCDHLNWCSSRYDRVVNHEVDRVMNSQKQVKIALVGRICRV